VIVSFSSSDATHHATVLVLDKGSPITDLLVFNSVNIPPKKTETAFEFDILTPNCQKRKRSSSMLLKMGVRDTAKLI
jgi:hypothetical protein